MALIKCPECGKEVSDKCTQCIHCGYPLVNYKCLINGVEHDFEEEFITAIANNDNWRRAIGGVRKKAFLNLSDGRRLVYIMRETKKVPSEFVPEYPEDIRYKVNNQSEVIITCPYCHSTNTRKISGASKVGSVAMFGVLGIGKTSKQWHCNNCNSDF